MKTALHRVFTRGIHEAHTKILTPFFDTIFNFNQSRWNWIRKCKPLSRGGWITKGCIHYSTPLILPRGWIHFTSARPSISMNFKIFQQSIFCRICFIKIFFSDAIWTGGEESRVLTVVAGPAAGMAGRLLDGGKAVQAVSGPRGSTLWTAGYQDMALL